MAKVPRALLSTQYFAVIRKCGHGLCAGDNPWDFSQNCETMSPPEMIREGRNTNDKRSHRQIDSDRAVHFDVDARGRRRGANAWPDAAVGEPSQEYEAVLFVLAEQGREVGAGSVCRSGD